MRSSLAAAATALLGVATLMSARAIDIQDFDLIRRGRYLVDMGDCGACHTLPGSGALLAGGRPLETPFGTLLAPNITPDPETGIGAWTEDEFVNSLTKGTGRNGTHLYPAMLYTYMTKITSEDALAIRAYLNTIPAVRLPFPFDVRASLVAWNALNFRPGEFQPVAGKSTAWNRGAYLVEGLAHCGLCHTPKNPTGGDETSKRFQGYLLQGWFAPDITNDKRRGIGNWSADDIVTYLRSGHNRFTAASGPMAEAIMDSTSKFTDEDLNAIATYLKDQPAPNATDEAIDPDAGVMKSGSAVYADQCAACHASDGSGVEGLFPILKGSALVQSIDPSSVLHVVLRGARSAATRRDRRCRRSAGHSLISRSPPSPPMCAMPGAIEPRRSTPRRSARRATRWNSATIETGPVFREGTLQTKVAAHRVQRRRDEPNGYRSPMLRGAIRHRAGAH